MPSFTHCWISRVVGVEKMQYFGQRSPGAIKEMFLQTGSVLKNSIVQEVKKSGLYGLLIDEVMDISVNNIHSLLGQHNL